MTVDEFDVAFPPLAGKNKTIRKVARIREFQISSVYASRENAHPHRLSVSCSHGITGAQEGGRSASNLAGVEVKVHDNGCTKRMRDGVLLKRLLSRHASFLWLPRSD